MQTQSFNTPTKGDIRRLRKNIVSKGLKYQDIKDLDAEALEVLNSELKTEYVTDAEGMILKVLTNIQEKRQYHKLVEIQGAMDFIARFDVSTFDFDSCSEEEEEVLAALLEKIVQKKQAKLEDREGRMEVRTTNRSMYLPQVTLVQEITKDGRKRRWRFETDLISTGLLPRMLESQGHKTEGTPLSLRIVNNLPMLKDQDGNPTNVQAQIPQEEWEILRQHGWMPTQGNLAWNWENKELRKILVTTFPKVIDMGAYNHRLNAPLIPGGYMENMTIKFMNPMAIDIEPQNVQEATQAAMDEISGVRSEWERDQECDGAGLYNPNHPLMAELVERYGKVVFQITLLRPDGLFAKGIIVPREGMDENDSIVLDMAQVKGSHKGLVAEGQVETGCYVGLMKSWDRLSYFPGSFELLEFIKLPKDQEGKLEAELALRSLLDEAVEDIAKDGIDGLMAEIARDDEQLKLIVKIIAQIRAHGVQLNPMSIPMVKAAIEDKLRAKLWVIAQGAGIRGRQYVTVLDATVPEGQCVLSGFKTGSELAIWRFPCVLPQGLVKCKVIKPRPHHLVDGKCIPNTVFLNPRDLTARMQGDDDGDIVGISNDPRVLTLFKNRGSERVYMVEPVGQKFEVKSDSEEGHKYLETDPRGPVGLTTIWQAQLLSVGDWWGALSMGVLNQEAIDAAKRKIEWTDVSKACEPGMWSQDEKGNMVLSPKAKLDTSKYEENPMQPPGWPGDYAKLWVKERLNKFGCIRNKKVRMNPLAWRIQTEEIEGKVRSINKRINPTYWIPCAQKDQGFKGGNLVHWCHDVALAIWKTHEAQWVEMFGTPELPVDTRDLLFQLMAQKGIKVQLVANSWEEYLELRKHAGITEYGQEFKKLLTKRVEEDVKFGAIEALNQQLHLQLKSLSAMELATVWYWELTPTYSISRSGQEPEYTHDLPQGERAFYRANKENYAFRAVSFPGSPILPLLGIEDVKGCTWLLEQERGTKIAQWVLNQPMPFKTLSERTFKNVAHGDERRDDNGNRVEFHQCQHCMEHITTQTIRGWRSSKTAGEKEFMRSLTIELNKLDRPWGEGMDDSFQFEEAQ